MKYLVIILLILFLYFFITYIMFRLICKKFKKNFFPMSKNIDKILKSYQKIISKGNDWVNEKIRNNEVRDLYIFSKDNLKLHGILIENKKNKGFFLEVHGYRSTAERDLYASCFEYYNMGYSLLIIDNRISNKSEGNYITFGIKESEDVICWINYLNKNYLLSKIVLAGVSMGTSTILMSLKDIDDKMNVICALADCGYIRAYDEILYCIKHYFHINGNLFITMINFWCKVFAKYDLKEKDTLTSLSNANIPILFIHGEDDDFVPCENTIINYDKYHGPKKIVLFKNTSHGISYLTDSKKYVNSIKMFVKKYNS